jgi:RNA polymerase sigma-70 factor (ECF subfamily)
MQIAESGQFDTLFQQYFKPLTRQVTRIVDCEHVAEELVQDVFLTMWSGRHEIDVRGDVVLYLRRAARNRALDWLRRKQKYDEWEQTAGYEAPRPSADGDEGLHQNEDHIDARLDELFATMPARRRMVCELRWRDNLRPSEIAKRLGIALKTVETHITIGTKEVKAKIMTA